MKIHLVVSNLLIGGNGEVEVTRLGAFTSATTAAQLAKDLREGEVKIPNVEIEKVEVDTSDLLDRLSAWADKLHIDAYANGLAYVKPDTHKEELRKLLLGE